MLVKTKVRKKLPLVIVLLSLMSVGLVYAQESGYLLNISNSNANIDTVISNSTVIENVTLSNGTLNLQINADNISSVTINGINYTAQQSQPLPSQTPGAPEVIITYFGENAVPDGLVNFPNPWIDFFNNQSKPPYYYSWNLTMVNINPVSGVGVPMDRAFQPLVTKYPMLAISRIAVPNQPYDYGNLTLWCDTTGFNGRMDKQCMVLFSYSQLNIEQVNNLTQDIISQLTPAIIEWYS
jgi:hypothetical protein